MAEGEGRRDEVTHRMSGRARDNRLVHFDPAGLAPRPGDLVTAVVTSATPHYLIADAGPLTVRRTRGGDAWQARREAADEPEQSSGPPGGSADAGPPGAGNAGAGSTVLLGMPALRAPA